MIDYFNDMTFIGAFSDEESVLSARVGSVEAGMLTTLQLKIESDVITDVRYKVYGNQYAIGSMAFVAHWLMGKTSDDLETLHQQTIIDAVSIPAIDSYCAVLAKEVVQLLFR